MDGKKNEYEKKKQEKNPEILLEDTYEIDINAFNLRDLAAEIEKEKERKKKRENTDEDWYEEVLNVKRYRSNTAWVPKIAIDCLYNFFISIKNEMGITGFLDTPKKVSIRALSVIRGKFLSDFSKGRDMEEVLLDYIEDLKEFNLYPPIEYIEKSLWKLRSYKINFFKKVLEEYRKDKEGYDKSLQISVDARKADHMRLKIRK